MARQTNHDGLYYEGSLRGGRVNADYHSRVNLVTPVGIIPANIDYDTSSTYWAAHLGIGKVMPLPKGNTLDYYLKYFYCHQNGDTVTVVGAPLDFSSVDSHRIRLGARLTHAVNETSNIYGGLAYQYEFDGDARATYNGNGTPSPSVKGSSGMLELGWQVKPGTGNMTLDLGVTGWIGKQRGVTAQLGAKWQF